MTDHAYHWVWQDLYLGAVSVFVILYSLFGPRPKDQPNSGRVARHRQYRRIMLIGGIFGLLVLLRSWLTGW